MNNSIIKKYLFIGIFLTLCSLSFSQNIKIIGVIPKTNTGKVYQLQIGAYRLSDNVDKATEILTKIGFVSHYEKKGDLTRVFVVVNAGEVRAAVDRLARAGFKEVVIREYTGKSENVKPVEVKPAETAEKIEPKIHEETKEPEQPEEHGVVLPVEENETWDNAHDVEFENYEDENEDEKTENLETSHEIPGFETDDPDHDLLHMYEE